VALITTRAVVLQSWRYSETSKIVRLATRELGVQSAIAKGALRPRSRFAAGLESLSEGIAHLYHRETRDLQILGAFDLIDLRRGLARDVGRFAGAAALAEIVLRMAPAAPLPPAYDALVAGCDALVRSPAERIDAVALRAVWALLGALGFEPSLTRCARDGTAVDAATATRVGFSIGEGGVLCQRCATTGQATTLPPHAYRDLLALNDPAAELPALDDPHAAAHRRLVTRFIRHHYGEAGGLNAVEFWTRRPWSAAS
jgi:DNA repair protein RecO (recombination protein O)